METLLIIFFAGHHPYDLIVVHVVLFTLVKGCPKEKGLLDIAFANF